MADRDEQPWEPNPIPAEDFHQPETWANINRAPYDRVAGVIYKRALNIKAVRYPGGQGDGEAEEPAMVVRWLFSELAGTEENLLADATFAFLHDVRVAPEAVTSGQPSAEAEDRIYYVVAGAGRLYHRPTLGSPIVARPLRPGDACLIRAGEYHHIENRSEEAALRLIVVGLVRREQRKDE